MSVKSVYLPQPELRNGRVHIDGEEHHHLAVARAEPDELLEIFDGTGNVWTAAVESVGKRETVARIAEARTVDREPEVILALAMIRIAAFEFAIEKAVEVGVTRIVPFTAARSNVAPGNRHDRWMRIVIEAAKQSKRYYLPALDSPMTLEQVLAAQGAVTMPTPIAAEPSSAPPAPKASTET